MRARDATLTREEAEDLTQQLVALGYRPAQITEIVRESVRRKDMADALIALQRSAPKATGTTGPPR